MAYKRSLFDPKSKEPFKISRSKIDLFSECPRCFYLDLRLGVSRPRSAPFTLNTAVDHLLKKEFDKYRADGTQHPLMRAYKIDAIPFKHKDIDTWRENFSGVQHYWKSDNFIVTGAVDDVWINKAGELIVVDYKATAKDKAVKELEKTRWHDQYRRQMEVYQWLLRQNGFAVSPTGYFVYVNGRKDKEAFDGKLEFNVNLIAYKGNDDWIASTLHNLKECLAGDTIPPAGEICEYCPYRDNAGKAFRLLVESAIPAQIKKRAVTTFTTNGKNRTKNTSTLF